jgi:hypothetical protein
MLCAQPVSGPSESGGSGGKDKTKKPACDDIIGLDSLKQFLLYIAKGPTFNFSLCFLEVTKCLNLLLVYLLKLC